MATNVTNAQIVAALQAMGIGPEILGTDTSQLVTGAQNSEFKNKVLGLGISVDDFNRAKDVARIGSPTTVPGVADLLRALGYSETQIDDTMKSAGVDIRSTGVDWTPKLQAVYQAIGQNFGDPLRRYVSSDQPPAVTQPPPPAPPAAKPAPVAAPPPAPGGPTISGATSRAAGAGGGGAGGGPGAAGTPPPKPLTPEQIRSDLNTRYGWAASLADIPEVQKILTDAANGVISEDEANNRWLASDYYKSTTVKEREWKILQGSDPGEAASQLEAQVTAITQKADTQGIQLDPARARQIAETSKRYGWSDQQVNGALASEIHYDPTGAKTGTLAAIKAAQRAQLVPLSDQAMTQWAQAIVGGTKTQSDFEAYLKDQAKSLFPSIAPALDDPNVGTVKHYLDPYAQTIQKTLGINAGDIDWTVPKWFRFVNQVDPKTGQRSVMNLADVNRTLISDPTYLYDQTANGKQQKAGLARTILQQWGYVPGGSQSSAGGF